MEFDYGCINCGQFKTKDDFYDKCTICKDCKNKRRRERYNSCPETRARLIAGATKFKQAKAEARRAAEAQRIAELEAKIGEENTICKYCQEVRPKTRFRHNRLKCADCERDDPIEKFKRVIRTRIWDALKSKKQKHTIEYLGCNAEEYLRWLCYKTENVFLENRGNTWHIDHVIPISKFDLDDEDEQELAFNWRNTMALSAAENLKKNNKILPEQIQMHLSRLIEYHKEYSILLPQTYIDLYAKHLDDGKILKQSLLLTFGNSCEDLG